MAAEARRRIRESRELAALAHPLRLDLINHLMASGPATASECARAVGDSPSNCSYHLRVLERVGMVEAEESADGRERPWRATITGIRVDDDRADRRQAAALAAVSLQRDQRMTREFLARHDQVAPAWRAAAGLATYTLRMTPEELGALGDQLDALIRPYLAPTRGAAPEGSALVHLGLHAFPVEGSS